jgi:hypothetical protein
VVVVDVNSTVACSLTAKKLGIRVAHVEAGLRSFDTGMPEEINRKLTDAISDLLFVTEESGARGPADGSSRSALRHHPGEHGAPGDGGAGDQLPRGHRPRRHPAEDGNHGTGTFLRSPAIS